MPWWPALPDRRGKAKAQYHKGCIRTVWLGRHSLLYRLSRFYSSQFNLSTPSGIFAQFQLSHESRSGLLVLEARFDLSSSWGNGSWWHALLYGFGFDWYSCQLESSSTCNEFYEKTSANVALFHIGSREWNFNKRDVYDHYCPNVDPKNDESQSYAAGWHIVRKTPGSVRFYRDLHHIDDSPSQLPNIPTFQEHRHDQSIMNLLLKCRYKEPRAKYFPGKLWRPLRTFKIPD